MAQISPPGPTHPIPVILDTDIGFDVDDVWALAFLLRCPELDVKLITTSTGDTHYRAAIVAKLLQIAGRTDIPIGIGLLLDDSPKTHTTWLGEFALSSYDGIVIEDGVGAMIDTIMSTTQTTTLLAIGPLPNVAAALSREPAIAPRTRFVGMHGSLRKGYLGSPKPMREYNVKQHSLSAQAVFDSDMEKVITPLDTCGDVILDGERFARIKQSQDPLTQAVIANHDGWFAAVSDWPLLQGLDAQRQSSVLYDSVAVYLAYSEQHLTMETLPVRVTDDGKTLIDDTGKSVRCATAWEDKDAFLDLLAERLS